MYMNNFAFMQILALFHIPSECLWRFVVFFMKPQLHCMKLRMLLQKWLYSFIWVFFAPNWGLFFCKAKRMSKLVYLNKGSKGCTAAMASKTCKKKPRANIKPFEQWHSQKSTICCNKSSFISSLCQEIGTVNIIRESTGFCYF